MNQSLHIFPLRRLGVEVLSRPGIVAECINLTIVYKHYIDCASVYLYLLYSRASVVSPTPGDWGWESLAPQHPPSPAWPPQSPASWRLSPATAQNPCIVCPSRTETSQPPTHYTQSTPPPSHPPPRPPPRPPPPANSTTPPQPPSPTPHRLPPSTHTHISVVWW